MLKYAHNKSKANVSLIDGRILIAVGGKNPISDMEATHEDITHAVRMGWVSIEGEEPLTATQPHPKNSIEFTKDPMHGSATIPVVKSKVTATSSTLGGEVTATTKAKKTKSKDKAEE